MKTILLADDSVTVRNLIKTTLCEYYNLVEVENGEEVVKKAQERDIDLFLLDLNMPVLDGIETTRNLRRMPRYADTPILMLTSEIKEDKKKQSKEAGATGWISKSVDQKDFLSAINKLMQ